MRSGTCASCCAVPIELSPASDQFSTQSVGRYNYIHSYLKYSVKGRELAMLIPSNLQILFSKIVHFIAFMVYVYNLCNVM